MKESLKRTQGRPRSFKKSCKICFVTETETKEMLEALAFQNRRSVGEVINMIIEENFANMSNK